MSIEYAHPTETVKKTITWDGNTEGKVAIPVGNMNAYKVSDTPIKITQDNLKRVVAFGRNQQIGEFTVVQQTVENGATMTVLFWLNDIQAVMVADGDIPIDDETTIEKGVYFLKINGEAYVSLLETEEEVIRNEVSSLSYQKAYPEFIEHLKNRKYDPPVTKRTTVITWDGNNYTGNIYHLVDNRHIDVTEDSIFEAKFIDSDGLEITVPNSAISAILPQEGVTVIMCDENPEPLAVIVEDGISVDMGDAGVLTTGVWFLGLEDNGVYTSSITIKTVHQIDQK